MGGQVGVVLVVSLGVIGVERGRAIAGVGVGVRVVGVVVVMVLGATAFAPCRPCKLP